MPLHTNILLLNAVWCDRAFMHHKSPFMAFKGSICNHRGQKSPLIFLSLGVISILGSALRNNLLNI